MRVALAAWRQLAIVRLRLQGHSVPEVAQRLSEAPDLVSRRYPPRRISAVADRALRLTPYQPRCLLRALVVYGLLHRQGDAAQLVIGLPAAAASKDAHAWVEVAGEDVGPPPGRGDHVELARY